MSRIFPALVLFLSAALAAQQPLLMQKPTVSKTHVAFSYAGDLWIVGRDGGDAQRLTSGPGIETDPTFSPDGALIAFTGEYDGNVDVFVVPSAGGVPKRLTWHPGADVVVGWSPDGKSVLFRSSRNNPNPGVSRLFTLALDSSYPGEVPLPEAYFGAYSPDGKRMAYVPHPPAQLVWKNYRGGRTQKIWIADLADSAIERVPRDNSNDFAPMWANNRVYFLSDRNGAVTLFSYDPANKRVSEVIRNNGLDIKSASAGPGAIVYEQFGSLHLLDLRSGREKTLSVRISGDLPEVREKIVNAAPRITAARISPTGARAVFEARGEVLTVPAEKGDVRNLTGTPGVHERMPAWSPDGRRIAYLSDESGEYLLHIRDQNGMGEPKKIQLGDHPSFYYSPQWSPDSKKIAYYDKRLNYWWLDVESGKSTKVDKDEHSPFFAGTRTPGWSPDSKWLVYTKLLPNHLGAVHIYSLESGKSTQVTDGMADARYAVWDRSGKYIFFTASTDIGPSVGGGDLSIIGRTSTRSVYVAVLRKDLPSPLAPESDEEKVAETKSETATPAAPSAPPAGRPGPPGAPAAPPEPVRVDFEDFEQRILSLPVPPRNYLALATGKPGVLYLLEPPPPQAQPTTPPPPGATPPPTGNILTKYDLNTRKSDRVVEAVSAFDISHNGEKLLFRQGQRWIIASLAAPIRPGEGALRTDPMEVKVDPVAEWKQMYREVWRGERDFFYDPNYHGLDLKAAEKKYEPYLASVASRSDLNYLFGEMLGELRVGHLFVGGGMTPDVRRVGGGLLGADYRIENGRYRLARVYTGESWNPQLRAPLTQPGVNVKAGEYLLAVNGRDLRAADNIFSFFENRAGKSVLLRVGPNPDGAGSREVTVVPVASEFALRNLAWIEENRRKVDKMTGGRVAYVYLPDTAQGGYSYFNRYFFAQIGKQAAVLDERYNGGGLLADYVVDYLRRPLIAMIHLRWGKDFTVPHGAIYGPKVMIINEMAGSGGDFMPHNFRAAGVGPLIGTRTWGGLVAAQGGPPLMDGGGVTAPDAAIYTPDGKWLAENEGVAPDIEVEQDPKAVRAGRDPQLERAVELVLERLKTNPPPSIKKPDFKNLQPRRESSGGAR
jgi:tricorn protease